MRQIWLGEADTRGRKAVVFDIGQDMLMMRMCASQLWNVWVFKGVIPEDLLTSAVKFVAVFENSSGVKVHKLPYIQDDIAVESYLSFQFG
jgi:hypothetical protein